MWERAVLSGGIDNPGRKPKKTAKKKATAEPAKMSFAGRRREKVAASLEGTMQKAPLLPSDPLLLSTPLYRAQQPQPQQPKPKSKPKPATNKPRAPLIPDDPTMRCTQTTATAAEPQGPPRPTLTKSKRVEDSASDLSRFQSMLSRAATRKEVNYDERDPDTSITQQLVDQDSGGDSDYDDTSERKRGGFSRIPGDGDDDEDIVVTPPKNSQRSKRVNRKVI